jgi:hypothetical protein
MPGLPELQRLFLDALSGEPSPGLLAVVERSPTLDAAGRVGIYQTGYLARIVEALREDFPRLAGRLAAEDFVGLVRAYLARHPSTHPSIAHVGARLADFLAMGADGALVVPPWAADLARLEWTRRTVFDAPDAPVLGLDDLRRVPPEEWGALRLAPVPAFATLVTGWPVHVLWLDEEADGDALAASRGAYRVWRRDFVVFHAAVDGAEEAALRRLVQGATFADVCEDLGTPEEAGALLLRWMEDGIVARGDPPGPLCS